MSPTRSPRSLALSLVLVALASAPACVGNHPLALACPCAPGWTCDDPRGVCVRDGTGGDQTGTGGQGGVADASVGIGGAGGGTGVADGGTGGAVVVAVDTSYPDGCQALLPPPDAKPGSLVNGCPCTRRPGPGNALGCPPGANASASAVIGPEGGTIALEGQQGKASGVAFSIEVPPGALKAAVTLTITETDLSPPTDFVDLSPVYRVGPLGVSFSKLVKLTVPDSGGFVMGPVSTSPAGGTIYESQAPTPCAFAALADGFGNAGFSEGSITETGYVFAGAPKNADLAMCP